MSLAVAAAAAAVWSMFVLATTLNESNASSANHRLH